jgi:hypothetical protein
MNGPTLPTDAGPVNETKMLVDHYGKLYLERFHEPATILWPREMGISSKLLKIHPFAKLMQWVREFIDSDDKQIAEGGRSFPQFQYHLSRIITRSSASKTVKMLKGIYGETGERSPIKDAVALLSVSFRADMELPQTRSYERALKELADQPEILQQAVERLIDEAANGRQFYPLPKPSDLKGACAKVMAEKRRAAAALHLEQCEHSSNFIYNPETRRDERCPCWKRAQQAMADVGQAIALPAAYSDPSELQP